jgi:hypothetical protein
MPNGSDPATQMIEAIREGLPPGVELYEAVTAALSSRRRG